MYKKKTISSPSNHSLVLPESFNASDYLKGPLARRTDDANYIVSTIYRRQAMGAGHGEDDFVRLNAATLNKIVAKDDARRILEALIPEAIERDPDYLKGSHSMGYRLNRKFVGDKCIRIKPSNPRLIRALDRESIRRKQEGQNDHMDPKASSLCQQLESQFHRISIDSNLAKYLIGKLPIESNPFDRQSVIIGDLIAKHFRVFPTRWGRIYNPISGLHTLVRPALMFNEKRLFAVDVNNSQPAFLGLKVLQKLSQTELPADLKLFMREVSEGRFYEALLAEFKASGLMVATIKHARTKRTMERRDVKDGFMMHVLAKEGDYQSEFREIFANRYPTVDAHITLTNKWSHKTLIRQLQQLEANFVIENVAAGALLLPSNPLVLTLHDSIICGDGQAELILGEFNRGFNEVGYRMVVTPSEF